MNLKKQPNSNSCFVCGLNNPVGLKMTFYDNGVDEVYCNFTVPEEYNGYPGVVHGGILATILDETVGRVALIADPNHFMFSVKLEVKYRHPVPTETPLKITGRIIKLRGRLGKAVGQIELPDGTIACESVMTLADVPKEMLDESNVEEFGWRVYPDAETV